MPEQPQQLTSLKQIKKAKLKGIIKGAKTATGEWAAKINTEPTTNFGKTYGVGRIHEETSNPAVATFGRHNPIHKGHEAIFNKMDKLKGKKFIYTSHSQNEKNPMSAEDKVKYIKKVVPSAEVRASSKESPTLLHMASHIHGEGHDELHVVVGSDRAADFEKTLNRYNGVKGPHGYYNFKKITVHSVGRDPDAEGVEGLSATKMRDAAKNNDHETFRSGLPDSIKQHSKEIMNKVRSGMSVKEALEALGISMDDLFEATALNRNWSRLSPESKDRVIKAYTSDEPPKPKSSFKKFSQSVKGRLNETGGAGDIGTDELVAKYKKDTPGEYEHKFKDAFNHYLNLLMKPENKGRPWEHIAGDVQKEYPNVFPVALNQKLRELIGGSDLELKYKIYDEEIEEGFNYSRYMRSSSRAPAKPLSQKSLDIIDRAADEMGKRAVPSPEAMKRRKEGTEKDYPVPSSYKPKVTTEAEVWDKPNPKKTHKKLSPEKKARAKARARAAGRPYPNLVDNMAVAKEDVDTSKIQPTEHLLNKMKATKDHSHASIDKIMRAVAHDYDIDVKQLHNMWVKKYKKTPDEYIKEDLINEVSSNLLYRASDVAQRQAVVHRGNANKLINKANQYSDSEKLSPDKEKQHDDLVKQSDVEREKQQKRQAQADKFNRVGNVRKRKEDKQSQANEEVINEISDELVGKVNKLRTLLNKPSKTRKASNTLDKAVEKVRAKSNVGKVQENFMDGKNPEDKGDMARHGLKGKSISQLKKIRSSDSASPRAKQLAHWYINMHKKD